MAELYFQETCMATGLQPEEIHYLSDTASSDKSGRPENNRNVPGHKRVRSFMEDQGDDSTRYESQEESSRLGAARGATLAYVVDTLDSLQEDYEVLQDEVSKLQRTVTALMSDYEDSRNNRTGTREIPSSSQVPASSRKNNEEYPAIPHSEEEIYAIMNYWLANGIINPPRPRRLPTENEKFHPRYCRYHQYVGHPTTACQKLRKIYYEGVDGGSFRPTSRGRTKGIFSP